MLRKIGKVNMFRKIADFIIVSLGGVTQDKHLEEMSWLEYNINRLTDELEKAQKNDHRDPKTGRFVKNDQS